MNTPTTTDFDKEYRHLIEHETKLVDGRMTWFILFQTILFAGFYESYDKTHWLGYIICVIGIVLSIIIRHSFWKNEKAISFILDRWNKQLDELGVSHYKFPPIYAGFTDYVHIKRTDRIWARFTPILLHHVAIPWLFFLAWIGVLTIMICIKCGVFVE